MKLRYFLIVILLFTVSFSANAQKGRRFDLEAIKKEKAEFLKKEMNLTEAESKTFLPLESEFMDKKFEINRDARKETRELKKKEKKTDADFKRITQLNLESNQRAAQIEAEYYKKFGQILSAEKVERYRIADKTFNEKLLREHKDRGGRK